MEEQEKDNEIITTSEVSNVPVSNGNSNNVNEDPLEMMQNIADSNYSAGVMQLTNSNAVKNQMKLFLISECKRELHKVVQYAKLLDVIELRFKERFIDNINEVPDAQLPQLMELLMRCIDRSNNLIGTILKDEEVLNLLIIQNNNFDKEEVLTSSQTLAKLYNSLPDSVNSSDVRSKIIGEVVKVINELGGAPDNG